MSARIALILGYGPNISHSVAKSFKDQGYAIAVVARKVTDGPTADGFHGFQADFADTDSIPGLFAKVKEAIGIPSVVVYNAAALTPPQDNNVLTLKLADLEKDTRINTWTPYYSAVEAAKGFEKLPSGTKGTFIYTGNAQATSVVPWPMLFDLSIGKAASYNWISLVDTFFKDKQYKFYYADERKSDGTLAGQAKNAANHAAFYSKLVTHPAGVPFDATFTGSEYVKVAKF